MKVELIKSGKWAIDPSTGPIVTFSEGEIYEGIAANELIKAGWAVEVKIMPDVRSLLEEIIETSADDKEAKRRLKKWGKDNLNHAAKGTTSEIIEELCQITTI